MVGSLLWAQETVFLAGQSQQPLQLDGLTLSPDETGHFEQRLAITEPRYIDLALGGQTTQVYVEPGSKIHLAVLGDDLCKDIRFRGDLAAENTYLTDLIATVTAYKYPFFRLPEDGFLDEVERRQALFLDALTDWQKQSPEASGRFVALEHLRIRAWWAEVAMMYGDLVRHFEHPSDETPKALRTLIAELNLRDETALVQPYFVDMLNRYVEKLGDYKFTHQRAMEPVDFYATNLKFDLIETSFASPKIRRTLMANVLREHFENYSADGGKHFLARLRQQGPTDDTYARLHTTWESTSSLPAGVVAQVYKSVDGHDLIAYVVKPKDHQQTDHRPVLALFHGGGWSIGSARWGLSTAQRFAERGYVAVSFQYRLRGRQDTSPVASMRDARSAIRWLRQQTKHLGIDPNQVVAYGWSAGGHIAAAAAVIDGFDEPGQATDYPCQPNALILLYPALDLEEDRWYQSILPKNTTAAMTSPSAFVRANLPPMMIAQGTADRVVPFPPIKTFVERMQAAGNQVVFQVFEGRGHLFTRNADDLQAVYERADQFLDELGFTPAE